MRTKTIAITLGAAVLAQAYSAVAQNIRDYYAEPGISPGKEEVGLHYNEQVDPFSGTLTLTHTDLVVPGNGGFDIKINRVYHSVQDSLEHRSVNGLGWTMHMGRIVVATAHADKLCNQSGWQLEVTDNPSIEFSDGGRELLVLSTIPNAYLISRSRWKADCNGSGMTVFAPDGTRYVMNQYGHSGGALDGTTYLYATRIEDRNGNALTIDYGSTNGDVYMTRISASDGRSVTFSYEPSGSTVRLASVTDNSRRCEYSYTSISEVGGDYEQLTVATRPDGSAWRYQYNPLITDGSAGSLAMKQMRYPTGATASYDYDYVNFEGGLGSLKTTVVSRKSVSGSGAWTYSYQPAYTRSSALDKTTINSPKGTYNYYHWGYSGVGSGSLWKVGLLALKEMRADGQIVEQVGYDWSSQRISNENYWHGRTAVDSETRAPILTKRTVVRSGGHITEYSDHDPHGNPRRIVETANFSWADGTVETRTTNVTYHVNTEKWILHLKEDESIVGVGTIDRTFNASGNLTSENRFGVATSYTYTGAGDIASMTNARGIVTTYENYSRGIPQLETTESVVVTRTVNPSGTIASITDGRGITRRFTYDKLARLESIDYPINADVSITRTTSSRHLVRGTYQFDEELDNFDRVVRAVHRDAASGAEYVQTYEYDSLGNRTFESYPNSTEGTRYEHDMLGRVTRVTHADGSYRSTSYQVDQGGNVTIRDENGNVTSLLYGAYGDPDDLMLLSIRAPEDTLTVIERNDIGQILRIWQGSAATNLGYARQFGYDSRWYLISRNDPETGVSAYDRDPVGNMTSKTVPGQGATFYTYDAFNRLASVDYPEDEADVSYVYDENGNPLSAANAAGVRTYSYDDNGNLLTESVAVESNLYSLSYTYDALDALSTVTYPSGRVIDRLPDAFGRPTRLSPYVTSVAYHPEGQLRSMTYANGQQTTVTLDQRNRVGRIQAGNALTILDAAYGYDFVGNVTSVSDAVAPGRSAVLEYDGLDRLVLANGVWGQLEYNYDEFGNPTRRVLNGGNGGLDDVSYYYTNLKLTHAQDTGRTRWYSYDESGNVRTVSVRNSYDAATRYEDSVYAYNAANHLVNGSRQTLAYGVIDGTVTKEFSYDAHGLMLRSTAGSASTNYLYSINGNLLGEYAGSAANGTEHVYLGRQRVATVKINDGPLAEAGPDAVAFGGSRIPLNADGSIDRDGRIVSYLWEQLSGPSGVLSNATSVTAAFDVPDVTLETTAVFRLTVTDNNGERATDTKNVSIYPYVAPVANAGIDQTVIAGQLATLDGTQSTGSGPLSYRWTQLSGPAVTLTSPQSATTQFTLGSGLQHWNLTFRLSVTDGANQTSADTVSVMVLSTTYSQDADGIPDAWEYEHFGDWHLYGADSDPDGDGLTNLQEYQEGTDPTTPEPPPVAVQDIYGVPGETINTIAWDPVRSAAGYRLYWSTSPGFQLATANRVDGVRSPYVHQSLTNGTSYYYALVAHNNTGESGKSLEVQVTPGNSAWRDREVVAGGDALATNKLGDKAIIWAGLDSNGYSIFVNRYQARVGWLNPAPVANGTGQADSLKVRMDDDGNILIGWRALNAQGVMAVHAVSFNARSGQWSVPSQVGPRGGAFSGYTTSGVSEFNDLLLVNGRAISVWTQRTTDSYDGVEVSRVFAAERLIGSATGWTATRVDGWTGSCGYGPGGAAYQYELANTYGVKASNSAKNGYDYFAVVWARDESDGQTRNYVRTYYAVTGTGGLYAAKNCPKQLQASGGSSVVSIDIDTSGANAQYFEALVFTRELVNNTSGLYLRRVRLLDTFSYGASLVKQLKGSVVVDGAHINVTPGGVLYYAWIEAGALYATNSANFSTSAKLVTPARGATLDGVQAQLGMDEGHVVSWVTSGNAAVARYDKRTGGWTTRNVNQQSSGTVPATRQVSAINGTGHIDALWRDGAGQVYLSSFRPPDDPGGTTNQPPVAHAGPDQSVVAGGQVTLDGSNSADPDGTITGYLWEQTVGPVVTLNAGVTAFPWFTAPHVMEPTVLGFNLTVTDAEGATGVDAVAITVAPESGGGDSTPPQTAYDGIRTSAKGIVSFSITLSPNEPASTYFRASGQGNVTSGGSNTADWQQYSGPVAITLNKSGSMTFEYYSVDSSGNTEPTQQRLLQ